MLFSEILGGDTVRFRTSCKDAEIGRARCRSQQRIRGFDLQAWVIRLLMVSVCMVHVLRASEGSVVCLVQLLVLF